MTWYKLSLAKVAFSVLGEGKRIDPKSIKKMRLDSTAVEQLLKNEGKEGKNRSGRAALASRIFLILGR